MCEAVKYNTCLTSWLTLMGVWDDTLKFKWYMCNTCSLIYIRVFRNIKVLTNMKLIAMHWMQP